MKMQHKYYQLFDPTDNKMSKDYQRIDNLY